jgi:hypothetical protein
VECADAFSCPEDVLLCPESMAGGVWGGDKQVCRMLRGNDIIRVLEGVIGNTGQYTLVAGVYM